MSEALWQAFKKGSDRAILFIIRSNPRHRFAQKIIIFFSFVAYMFVGIIIGVNIIKREEGIVIAVVNGVFLLMIIAISIMIFELITKKNHIIDVITWCTEPTWKKFDKSLQPHAANRFNRARHISTRIILLQIKMYDFLAITASVGVGLLMQLIPSLRYQLPMPWHLPIKNYKNLKAFCFTLAFQTFCTVSMTQVITFFSSFIIVFYIHIREYLEIILQGFDSLNQRLRNEETKRDVNVNDSLKVLVKMISSSLSVMSTFTRTMSNILMCMEIISYCSIFTNAFIMLIVKQKEHYFIGCSILVLNLITMGIGYMNDNLKEIISKVSYALYELPWDELTPKQRMFIQFSMKCINVDVALNCANMHEFNLERFGNITKQAYSNTLVLKRVLEKNMNGFE